MAIAATAMAIAVIAGRQVAARESETGSPINATASAARNRVVAPSRTSEASGAHRLRPTIDAELARAELTIVIAACADDAPGTTVAGVNEQLLPAGRFAQLSAMAFVNAPPTADTVT